MQITIYNERPDETILFDKEITRRGWTTVRTAQSAVKETLTLARGSCAIFITPTTRLTAPVIAALHEEGIRYILTRSTGVDHIDIAALTRYGMKMANVPVYSQHAVPEFSLLLALSLIRRFPQAEKRVRCLDFTMDAGIQGKELASMTAGVIGTGQIGGEVIRLLHGFGSKILAYSPHPKKALLPYASFTDIDTLFRQSDILFLQCALNESTMGMINSASISHMKDGVYIVNTARGELLTLTDVLSALRSGKIAGLAADVVPGESLYLRRQWKGQAFPLQEAETLLSMDNVIYTPHMAYFTNVSVQNIIAHSFEHLDAFLAEERCKRQQA